MREQEVLIGLGQQKHGGRDERIFGAKVRTKIAQPDRYKHVRTVQNETNETNLGSKNTLIVSAVQCMP